MRNTNREIDGFTRKLMLDHSDIELRQAFLGITETDVALLREIHTRLAEKQSLFVDAFYDHLLQFPPLQELLKDALMVARLKQTQTAYFDSLTGGEYGADYVSNRLRVGIAHQRIGLEPQWYIGAYRKYLSELLPVLRDLLKEVPEKFLPTYDALLKIVCFDMSLAMDTYIRSDQQEIFHLKNYSEQIISNMPSGVMVIDGGRTILTMNHAIRSMFGLGEKRTEDVMAISAVISNQLLLDFIDQGLSKQDYQRDLVITLSSSTGADTSLRCTISRTLLDEQNLLILMVEDITTQMQARADLLESEERFRVAFGQAAVGLAHVGLDGHCSRVNQKFQDIIGYSEQELLNLSVLDLIPVNERHSTHALLGRLLGGEIQTYAKERQYIHKDGHLVWLNVSVAPISIEKGPGGFIAVIEDISQRKQFEQKLQHLAHHDALTGLSNRVLLLDRLSQAMTYANRAGRFVAVLFIDLDRFKNINDSLGHDAGDQVIVEVARRLSLNIREGDTVARLGGDEFVVVLSDIAREDEIALLAQKILDALFLPMIIQGQELSPIGSIGISVYPQDGKEGSTLLKNADAVMYQAKGFGRNNFQFYAQEMNARTLDRLKLEGGLRHALEREEFILLYQPQMDISSGEIVGVEALLRWQPLGKPMVMPNDFIPIAEETGLIVPIGEWVLRTACAQHVAWKKLGLPEVRMAVNLSARQFRQKNLEQLVARVLREAGCGATCLELEITESVVMDNPEAAAQTLQKLSDMGVQLSIDDFGTGYSSLSYLKRFPIHSLKIDRSFVKDITTDANDAAIAKSIIALAHSMKLKVVAEGVETDEQLIFLGEQQCDHIQGYHLSRPVSPEQLQLLMKNMRYPSRPQCSGG